MSCCERGRLCDSFTRGMEFHGADASCGGHAVLARESRGPRDAVQGSSGTTGLPRGAELPSQPSLAAEHWPAGRQDRPAFCLWARHFQFRTAFSDIRHGTLRAIPVPFGPRTGIVCPGRRDAQPRGPRETVVPRTAPTTDWVSEGASGPAGCRPAPFSYSSARCLCYPAPTFPRNVSRSPAAAQSAAINPSERVTHGASENCSPYPRTTRATASRSAS